MAAYSVNEIIEMAVQIERNGYAFYNEATKCNKLDDKSLALLLELRDQEVNHEQTFLKMRDNQDLQALELTSDWELISSYLKTIVDSRLFNCEESAICAVSDAANAKEIIEDAIRFEKDTLLYFNAFRDLIKDERAKQVLHSIILEETSHVLRLTEYQLSMA